jgi:hypothetical protein
MFLEMILTVESYDSRKVELQHAVLIFEPGSKTLAFVKLEIELRLMLWKFTHVTGCEVFILL